MSHSIAEHGQVARLDKLQTLRELIQELYRTEQRLREARAQQVLSAESPERINDEISCEPPAYEPSSVYSGIFKL